MRDSEQGEFRADSPVCNWLARVRIGEQEQRQQHDRQGRPFLTVQLLVLRNWNPQVQYSVSGPNIRQDGTPGARTLSRYVSRADVDRDYPAAMKLAVTMLSDGAQRIQEHAQTARAQIAEVISEK